MLGGPKKRIVEKWVLLPKSDFRGDTSECPVFSKSVGEHIGIMSKKARTGERTDD